MTTLSNRLTDLAERIRETNAAAQDAERTAAQKSLEAGQLLATAKAETAHGQWLPFLARAGMVERLPINNARNTRGQPFRPGNPGRPKGARNRRTLLAERLMAADLEHVTKAVIDAARGGDMVAARLILERLVPVRRGRPVKFTMPESVDAAGIAEAFADVLARMADGEITPEEATAIAAVLEVRRKAIETVELEARLAALERKGK